MPQIDRLDPDKIKPNSGRIGAKVLIYDRTSSTNDIAAQYAKNKENDGLVIFAEQQTAGRGRGANKWLTGCADSILCSVVLIVPRCTAEMLSLTSAVAVAETIGRLGGRVAKIKWPNDIIVNDRKIAGILLESKTNNAGPAYIIGTGINCHQTIDAFPPELQSIATSIDIETRTTCDRISLAKRLLASMDHWLEMAETDGEKVIDRWRSLSTQLGSRVTLLFDGRKFTGNCIGIDPQKGLILQLDTGGIRMFPAAHTSILK